MPCLLCLPFLVVSALPFLPALPVTPALLFMPALRALPVVPACRACCHVCLPSACLSLLYVCMVYCIIDNFIYNRHTA
jgi:hypothetical protein